MKMVETETIGPGQSPGSFGILNSVKYLIFA